MKYEALKKIMDNVFVLNSSFPLILGLISNGNIASSVNKWSSRFNRIMISFSHKETLYLLICCLTEQH